MRATRRGAGEPAKRSGYPGGTHLDSSHTRPAARRRGPAASSRNDTFSTLPTLAALLVGALLWIGAGALADQDSHGLLAKPLSHVLFGVAPPVVARHRTRAASHAASSNAVLPLGGSGTWKLALGDEFNGSALNTSIWSTGWFGSGITGGVTPQELQCYDPQQVVVGSGELDLNLIAKQETCAGHSRPYASGMVTTNGKFSYTYGFLEIRAWLPSRGGRIVDWPGLWADGQNWPTTGELDVLEGLSGSACWHFHDPMGGPGGCTSKTFTGGWHTFGADWEPGHVTYYYDGKAVGSITSGITSAPMYLILGLGTDPRAAILVPSSLRIAYVRVWQHA